MELTREHVLGVVDTYIRAWTTKDPDLIVSIFTETGTYHERVLEEPIRNSDGIRKYWETKVIGAQDRITCKMLSLYLDGNTAIVEWEAEFDDLAMGVRKHMQEIAVLEFDGPLIASLREYWSSKALPEPIPGVTTAG